MNNRWLSYLFSAVLLLGLGFRASAQYRDGALQSLYDSETVAAMKEHVGYLASYALEGRKAGSEGERLAAEYVTQVLESYDVDVLSGKDGDVFGMAQAEGDTLTSRNVVAFVQGWDRSLQDRYIVVGARLDNLGMARLVQDGESRDMVYAGANGNASGLAMLLELARMVSTNRIQCRRSVLFVAFGASSLANAGSWYFINRSFAKDAGAIDAMVNLDMLGTGYAGFYGFSGSNADMNSYAARLKGTLQPVFPEIVAEEPYPSDHRSFYAAEIPSMFFTTGRYPQHNSWNDTPDILDYEWMERELEYIFSYTVALANGEKPLFRPEKAGDGRRKDPSTVSYFECDARPTFLGSAQPETFLKKWVYQYLRYPADAVSEGVQGNVVVDFVIDEKGKVTEVEVTRGVDERLDAEALRVVKASPAWKPGRKGGKKVRARLSITVEFRLEKKGSGKLKLKK
ncbi:MAG: TonB family protein [Bacteroidota bacterium]|nr:TonB family protein [Bacteroidota bacterium]